MPKKHSQAFDVYLGRKLIDTVFYSVGEKIDREDVRRALIRHDGYDPNIIVRKCKARKGKHGAANSNSK